jgi:hypothetical protein
LSHEPGNPDRRGGKHARETSGGARQGQAAPLTWCASDAGH